MRRTLRTCTLVSVAIAALTVVGCTTPDGQRKQGEAVRPPEITATMPLNQALEAGIDFGGDTLVNVKRLIKKRKEGDKSGKLLEIAVREGMLTYEPHQMLNAGHLLAYAPTPMPVELFKELIASARPLARQLGWQLAANKPSPALARALDDELTRAVNDNEIDAILMPQMANAVRANRLASSYTLLRQGLMTKGDEEFATAMFELNPAKASDDMLPYLSMASAEELRQLTLTSVNLYTVIGILKRYQARPPSIGAAGVEALIVYAVSRNTALAELAQGVLETFVPRNTEALAQAVARQPAWVQIAYLENVRLRMNPKVGLLLSELKKATAEDDVMREIDEIKL